MARPDAVADKPPHNVVITGMGLVSALADRPAALYEALCAGQTAHKPVTLFDPGAMGPQQACQIDGFAPADYLGKQNFRPLNRAAQFTCAAAHLALEDSGWTEDMRRERDVGLVLGTMFCSIQTITRFDHLAITRGPAYASPLDFANTVINAATGQTAIWHNLRGINSTISTGPTSGLQALGYAADLVRSGRAPAVLTGGVEELSFEVLYACRRAALAGPAAGRPVPFDAGRDGFSLGEGAAFLMLEEEGSARARGANILARIDGYGTAFDPLRGADEERAVATAGRALTQALANAGVESGAIAAVAAGANGSPLHDRIEARALAQVWGEAVSDLPINAVKAALGEPLGTGGALQAIALLQSMHSGVLPGIQGLTDPDLPLTHLTADNARLDIDRGLLNGVGFDGTCCAVVLSRAGTAA